mmetsp:Transcript_7699/g.8710  ORF Transcript_7699/g.8710 Transcript_7699/m.8710 type:complete len:115 (-) Transcript_7699:103-447(-)
MVTYDGSRHAAIYKRYVKNPREIEFQDYSQMKYLTKGQDVTLALALVGAMIPMWALGTSRSLKARNAKIWTALITAHLSVIGSNTYFNFKFRGFLDYLDNKYFSSLSTKQLEKA